MKQKDIGVIVIIVFISAILSFFISKTLFGSATARQQNAPVVQAISSSFQEPSRTYFNSNSFDPTQIITIGQNANPDPFTGDGSGSN